MGASREKLTTNRAGWSGKSSGNAARGAHGGYQFSRHFAVEGGVSSLGQVEATSGGRKDKFTLGTVSANRVGYLPVTDRFSALGIIGAGWEVGRRCGDVESRNASAGFLNAGLGAAYDASPNWHVRVQYVNYSKLSWKGSNEASVRSDMITTGVDYRFR
ncbi:outer membrane beta-barrel protein [Paraburkholderia kururiensis]|uniref:outer membrane beta-barrel protein n=1 Tax=Paraburkholderia kururiensis TaxID=984307 RepID=UPI0039A44208